MYSGYAHTTNVSSFNSGDVHTTVSLTISFRHRSFIFKVHEINWVSATDNRRQTDSVSVSLKTHCESCIRTYHGSNSLNVSLSEEYVIEKEE